MRYLILIITTCVTFNAYTQKSHSEILNMAKEIKVIDRLYLDIPNLEKIELDEATATKFFRKMHGGNDQLSHNTKYYVSGKITKHPDFDLLFLYAEKSTPDTAKDFNLMLLTTKKDGTQISMIDAAFDYHYVQNNQPQYRRGRSYLYNGFKIKQENEISVLNKKAEMEYRINDYGLFVSYPKN